jgi:hypothetical protein
VTVKIIHYTAVCTPERLSVRDLVESQAQLVAEEENPHLEWGGGYLYEYVAKWDNKEPYAHYIIAVKYTPHTAYRRYAIVDQSTISFADTLKEARGNAIPILITRADDMHPRTQEILEAINARERQSD